MTSAAEIAALAGGAKKVRGGYMIKCPAHDERTGSCKVWDNDEGEARFHCFGGCDWRDVRDAAERLGWLPPFEPGKSEDPKEAAARRERAAKARLEREARDAAERERMRQAALKVWRAAKPVEHTIAETYLRKCRGLQGPFPPTLRFHGATLCTSVNLYLPALVCLVTNGEKQFVGVQRIFLKQDGSDKAPLSSPKLSLGPIGGGAIRLAPASESLAVCEGVEDGLSVQQSTDVPTWAAPGTQFVAGLVLPPLPMARDVVIWPDGDDPGRAAAKALAERAESEGRTARVVEMPDGEDANSILRRETP